MPTSRRQASTETQLNKFKEAAREHEADDSEEHFNEALKRVAKGESGKARARSPQKSK